MIIMKSFFIKLLDNWPVKILSLAAAVVLMQLYKINTLEERFFTVPLEVQINENYIAVDNSVDKVRIRLRGSEEDVYSVLEDDIQAYIDLSSKTVEGEFQAPIMIKKKGSVLNINNLEIIVDPIYARTHLEQKLTRSIFVQPRFNEFPLSGYKLEQFFIAPSSVTVTGPKSQIEDLQFLQTEEIDLLGRFEDFTVLSRLVHDSEDITILGGDVIEFTGIISEELLIRTFSEIDIYSVDMPDSLLISGIFPKATIKIQGTQQRLEKIKLQNLQFTIDCSGITGPGRYSLPVMVDIPDDLTVLTYTPPKVEFEVVFISDVAPEGEREP